MGPIAKWLLPVFLRWHNATRFFSHSTNSTGLNPVPLCEPLQGGGFPTTHTGTTSKCPGRVPAQSAACLAGMNGFGNAMSTS
jgi:hypothetical protein